ncbi:MAG: glycosyltransferase family 4 protein [Clostridiales bacterium]|nr:glycosyltransferase family 4 protein [Clostridiales bacterium]
MLKVLYLLNYAGKAGTERYVQTLITEMNGKKLKAYFACNIEGLLLERMQEAGIETFRIKMNSRFDLMAAWKLSKLCRRLGIDIIHAQFLRENYIAMLSRIFNPKVGVVYTNHFIMENNAVTKFSNRILTHLQAGIIAVCNKGREVMISNGMDGRKMKVLFNAVDPAVWGKRGESTLRTEFGIDEDEFVMLCASRFAHDKGHAYLVRSVARLKQLAGRKFRMVLAGDGPLMDEIKAMTEELGLKEEIIFTGFRSDIKNLYDGSDLYINSSAHEASSFNIIEALACGLPVIAADMGGNSDIVNAENNCGLLVRYDDPEDMAQAMNRIMIDPQLLETLKRNAYRTVDEKHNTAKMVEQTYKYYEEFISKR